jgi:hypothetical protein
MIVVSGPYSHSNPDIKQARVKAIADACVTLFQNGEMSCSPLLAGLSFIEKSEKKMPDDYSFWQKFCRAYVEIGHKLYVLDLDGWQESSGVKDEIDCALENSIPVYLVESNTLSIIKQI